MKDLKKLERAVLAKLLTGDNQVLAVLREQAEGVRVVSREYSGAGFFCSLAVLPGAPVLATSQDIRLGDVDAVVDGLKHGAGFLLLIRGGRLDTLEGYSYEEPWPTEIGRFELKYLREPRELQLPTAASELP